MMRPTSDNRGGYTAEQAAAVLGIKVRAVTKRCAMGTLRADKVGKEWRVYLAAGAPGDSPAPAVAGSGPTAAPSATTPTAPSPPTVPDTVAVAPDLTPRLAGLERAFQAHLTAQAATLAAHDAALAAQRRRLDRLAAAIAPPPVAAPPPATVPPRRDGGWFAAIERLTRDGGGVWLGRSLLALGLALLVPAVLGGFATLPVPVVPAGLSAGLWGDAGPLPLALLGWPARQVGWLPSLVLALAALLWGALLGDPRGTRAGRAGGQR